MARRRVQLGVNDLATTHPKIAEELDEIRSGFAAESVGPGSHLDAWWSHHDDETDAEHVWHAHVYARAAGNRCAICTNKQVQVGVNDLATTHRELAKQLDVERSGFTAEEVTAGDRKHAAYWKKTCASEGGSEVEHRWGPSTIQQRARAVKNGVRGAGEDCSVCAGHTVMPGVNDFATTQSALATQWHPTRNGDLRPTDVTESSHRKVWWAHEHTTEDGRTVTHEWEAAVYSRKNAGCAICRGYRAMPGVNDLFTTSPHLEAEWDHEKNTLDPLTTTDGSHKKAWWRCAEGHTWQARIDSRTLGGNGCDDCNEIWTSRIEQAFHAHIDAALGDVTNGARVAAPWNSGKRRNKTAAVDMLGTIGGRQFAVEFDGRYWHRDRLVEDTAKTRALLDADHLVVRIREQPLPDLELEHPDLAQFGFEHAADPDPTAERVVAWLRERAANRRR